MLIKFGVTVFANQYEQKEIYPNQDMFWIFPSYIDLMNILVLNWSGVGNCPILDILDITL